MSLIVGSVGKVVPETGDSLTVSVSRRHRVCVTDNAPIPDGSFPLLIAVATSPDDRVRLAELVDGVAPLLLVSGLDELRRLITPVAVRRTDQTPSGTPAVAAMPAGTPTSPAPTTEPEHAGATAVLSIDAERSVARWRGREVPLTRLELDLLTCLNTQPLRTWTYADLHHTVWRSAAADTTGDVQSLVKRLRRKLDRLGTSVTVDAVRGTGFRLSDHQRPTIT